MKRQRHPNSLANLRPWKPGKSANPMGRPKKLPITDRFFRQCEDKLPDDVCKSLKLKRGATWGDLITQAAFRQAAKGNIIAIKEIREAIEGKAPQRIELGGSGLPIEITVKYDRPPDARPDDENNG